MNRRRAMQLGVMSILALLAVAVFAAVGAAGPAQKAETSITLSGTITGVGGSGDRSWMMPIANARIECAALTSSVTSLPSGEYSLGLAVPPDISRESLSVIATAQYFETGQYDLTAESVQVKDFLLRVLDTQLTVRVLKNNRLVRNAKVSIFGYRATTGRDGEAEFQLELKPATKYDCRVTYGSFRKTVSVTSKPGGLRMITVRVTRR